MADLFKTITNEFNVFALAPSNKWGEYNWGAFRWGEGTNTLPLQIGKFLSETVSFTDSYYRAATKKISETVTMGDFEATVETLSDGSGYSYVYPGNTTDADDRVATSWTSAAASTSWTSGPGTGTSWSEL